MVPRVTPGQVRCTRAGRRARRGMRRAAADALIGALVLSLFCVKIANYVDPDALRPPVIARELSTGFDNTVGAISNLPILHSCPGRLRMSDIPGGYVCARPKARGRYAAIYTSYPLVGRGREVIYPTTDEGGLAAANDLMRNVYDVPRYPPVTLPAVPTWSEDPYPVNYWRFEFYSLRPGLNLLYAYRETGNAAYARKLVSLDLSFIAAEPRSRWAWADPHAAAFRCMSLIDTWWKLRQAHQLGEHASTAILRELEKTGAFLADVNHYQIGENHGTNEAAALYNLAVAFPTLPSAHHWLLLAKQRIEWQLKSIIDADGQLIENSPFYDFYTLEKYWEIYQYMMAQRQALPTGFAAKLRSMLNFASYILQPNLQVPLLGASIQETIHYHGVYARMAAADPGLLYVLTRGARGKAPPADTRYFPASALTVMRSGWQRGAHYQRSTYLTYNIGRYRTAHSDLDALGITLYADGGDLLPDPGLYTYVPGAYHNYFHGTASHNDVTVDGRSQSQGNGSAGPLASTDGITYQSAESSLYHGVQHRRLVMLLGANHVLIEDQLSSRSVHTYRQMFHLFPGARLRRSGLTVSGAGGQPSREVTIQQLRPGGITESAVIGRQGRHPRGLCSVQYAKLIPCYQISYRQRGRDATFLTLLTIGRPRQPGFGITAADDRRLQVEFGGRQLSVVLGNSNAVTPRAWATDRVPPRPAHSVRAGAGRHGKLAFVFDDGSESILPAAAYLHRNSMAASVGVIGKYVDYPTQGYLNAFQLRALQNDWGWDVVNHTQEHVNAVRRYYRRHDLTGYANDIVKQATWLESRHLNSAPNWLLYPDGATNSALQKVVRRYYMFGAGTAAGPDAYPFGNREDVHSLEIRYPGDGESGDLGETRPQRIISAIRSARRHHQTLLLTFHRIHSRASDPRGYPLRLFKRVVNAARRSGIRVMTLSELDRSDGVPVTNEIHADPGKRSQITVDIGG